MGGLVFLIVIMCLGVAGVGGHFLYKEIFKNLDIQNPIVTLTETKLSLTLISNGTSAGVSVHCNDSNDSVKVDFKLLQSDNKTLVSSFTLQGTSCSVGHTYQLLNSYILSEMWNSSYVEYKRVYYN